MKTNQTPKDDQRLEHSIAAEVESRHGEKSFDQLGMKLAEETGEVVGAINKLADGRSVAADVDAEIGDVLIVLCQFAARRGCTLEDYIVQRWATVRSRGRERTADNMISTPIIDDLRARLAAQENRTREVIGEEFIDQQSRLTSRVESLRAALALADSELRFWLSHARAASMFDSGRDTLAVLKKVGAALEAKEEAVVIGPLSTSWLE